MYMLEAHIAAGTTIENAAKEIVDLCQKIQDKVVFGFNGLPIPVEPKDTVDDVIRRYKSSVHDRKLANALVTDAPNTQELRDKALEFINGYRFKDSKQVYTNGTELVPVFRVRDMLTMMKTGDFEYREG